MSHTHAPHHQIVDAAREFTKTIKNGDTGINIYDTPWPSKTPSILFDDSQLQNGK